MSAAHIARGIRRTVLEQSKRANVGHIGSALSIADVLAALFDGPLADARPDDPDRNRLVLSKGHAALALYAALHACGRLSSEDLNTFAVDDADATAAKASELGGEIVAGPFDAPWTRMAVIKDPQGATFIASQFVPENKDLEP